MEKMEKKDLEKLTKEQLIKLLLKQKKSKKVSNHEDLLDNDPFKDEVAQEPAKRIKPPKPTRKPPPPPILQVEEKVPSSKIKELNRALKGHAKSYDIELQDKKSKKVSNHEDLLDNDPFKDEVAQEPAKRIKPPKLTRKPPPPPILQVEEKVPSSKIKELNRALKGHAKSYDIELQDKLNPLNHFTKTKALVKSHLEDLLKDMKGFKFIETLEVTFEKDTIDSKLESV